MTELERKRNRSIDIEKGIAILCVVLGHVICEVYDNTTYNQNLIFKICYSFHMPLFIYISGYLIGKKENYSNAWMMRKVKTLLCPYVFWTLIYCIIYDSYSIKEILLVRPAYWFLINLFIYHFVTWVCSKTKYPAVIEIACYMLFVLAHLYFRDANLIIKNVVLFFVFYLMGKYVSKFDLDKKKIFVNLSNWSILFYPISMIFFTYKQYDEYVTFICENSFITNVNLVKAIMYFYNHVIVAVLGVLFVVEIVKRITNILKNCHACDVLSYLGKVTLPIYMLHEYFFISFFNTPFLNALVSFLISVICSVIIYEVFSLVNIINIEYVFGSRGSLLRNIKQK